MSHFHLLDCLVPGFMLTHQNKIIITSPATICEDSLNCDASCEIDVDIDIDMPARSNSTRDKCCDENMVVLDANLFISRSFLGCSTLVTSGHEVENEVEFSCRVTSPMAFDVLKDIATCRNVAIVCRRLAKFVSRPFDYSVKMGTSYW